MVHKLYKCLLNILVFNAIVTICFVYVFIFITSLTRSLQQHKDDIMRQIASHKNTAKPQKVFEETWIKVPEIKENVWIYSAYYLDEEPPKLKLYGIRATNSYTTLFCHFIYRDVGGTEEGTRAQKVMVSDNESYTYEIAAFLCEVPHGLTPEAVSLAGNRKSSSKQSIKVTYPSERRWEFTVCCDSPIFGNPGIERLIEMIELNSLLGAEQIFFYNNSLSSDVDGVLRFYQDKGLVTVVQWNLPREDGQLIHVHNVGQITAINDCIHRNMHSSKFIVLTDIDEFVIPRQWDNWNDMINAIGDDYGVYMFRNAFFPLQLNNSVDYPGKMRADTLKATSLLKLRRLSAIWPYRSRSKYCINPRANDVATVHYVLKLKEGKKTFNVPLKAGILQHYRDTVHYSHMWNFRRTKVIEDTNMLRFKDKLLDRLNKTYSENSYEL